MANMTSRKNTLYYLTFCFQSDREKAEGLPVAPFMDRDKVSKPTAQIGFIKFVLIPLFELLNKVFIAIIATELSL